MSFDQIGTFIQSIGLVGGMALILFAGYKGWWVWGSAYVKLEAERDRWQAMALRNLDVAEASVEIAKKVVVK